MAAAARKRLSDVSTCQSTTLLRVADASDEGVSTFVHEQHEQIEAAFSRPEGAHYPHAVKLAILIGTPLLLWGGIFLAAADVGRMLPH